MGLKILHLSDIHFRHYNEYSHLDIDSDIRNELEIDLENLVRQVGRIDVILIGGDIAFSGSDKEYEEAHHWLKKICQTIECSEVNVLTVPGNHDVDRSKICPMLSDAHNTFKALQNRGDIDEKLSHYLTKEESSSSLLKTFENYENFAIRYGAIPQGSNPLYWEKDFEISGYKLRIRGVNSAIVSNKNDDEHTSKLFLGSMQTQLKREKGVFYLFLCHHPPQWLYDQDDVEFDLTARAKIQLFGHKHNIRVVKIDDTLRFSAGAVQPPRSEKNWEPRYNVIEIEVDDSKEDKFLLVNVWRRVWNPKTKKFQGDFSEGREMHTYSLKLDEIEKIPKDRQEKSQIIPEKTKEIMMADEEKNIELINPQDPDPLRTLAYMFLSLPYHHKLTVAVELNLIEDEDKSLSEIQKSRAYLKRAKDQNNLDKLWDKVITITKDSSVGKNPFK